MIPKLLAAWCLVALTVTIHAAGLSAMLPRVSSALSETRFWQVTWRFVKVASWLIVLHLAEIVVWALFYWWRECMPDAESSFYFSGVTYTTVGYGDLVLPEEWRLIGSVEGLIGILMCGLSAASFFAVVSKLLPRSAANVNGPVNQLLKDIQRDKLLWLLAFVPVVFAAR